jgi:hypothetical protein
MLLCQRHCRAVLCRAVLCCAVLHPSSIAWPCLPACLQAPAPLWTASPPCSPWPAPTATPPLVTQLLKGRLRRARPAPPLQKRRQCRRCRPSRPRRPAVECRRVPLVSLDCSALWLSDAGWLWVQHSAGATSSRLQPLLLLCHLPCACRRRLPLRQRLLPAPRLGQSAPGAHPAPPHGPCPAGRQDSG